MLSRLRLSAAHADGLLDNRGLSDTTIAAKLYATVPDEARGNRLATYLSQKFDLRGVPGFYEQDGWRLNAGHSGFYVPCRDALGRIVGCQIRRDGAENPKYLWLSSRDKPGGASSGAPPHFAMPDLAARTRRAVITEGILKADVCADLLGCCVVGFAGVSTFPADAGMWLRGQLPRLAEVAVAYDADFRDKKEVRAALARLHRALKGAGLRVRVWTWDEGKGFDDYLLARRAAGIAAGRGAA